MPATQSLSDLWLFISIFSDYIGDLFKLFFNTFSDNIFLMFPIIMLIVAMGVLAFFRVISS